MKTVLDYDAICLSGGGAKGAYQVGVLRRFAELTSFNEHIDVFSGISVGAANASFLSQFQRGYLARGVKELEEMWRSLKGSRSIYKKWLFGDLEMLWRESRFDARPWYSMVKRVLNVDDIRSSGRKLRVGAVSETTGDYRIWTEHDDIIQGVCASSAFPVMFQAVKVDDEYYTDGGIREIAPVDAAIEAGAKNICVILASPSTSPIWHPKRRSVIGRSWRTIDIMSDEIIRGDIDITRGMIADGVHIDVIEPLSPVSDDSLDFDPIKINKMIEIGYRDGLEHWEKLSK